jgi:centromeric protein E
MAASLPRPSRPSFGPPTTALPALPAKKTRKSTGGIQTTPELLSETIPSLPRSALRAPSTSSLPTTPGGASLPKSRAVPGVNGAGKTIRKTISINAFPQPPRGGPGGVRTTSLPPSPLSGGATSASAANPYTGTRRESTEGSSLTPGGKLRKKSKPANSPNAQSYVGSTTPSLLNGSGDSRSISSGPGARGSDGLLSLPSPPQSRSSSAQDSYSTSATTYDDNGELTRGRETLADHGDDNRLSKPPEGKGNVIVSVRVRPDANTAGNSGKGDGDWMIDGRKSLVSYRGKEAGEYYYGK